MAFILTVQFEENGSRYYINTCDHLSTFTEVYSPQFATEFSTEAAALAWAKDHTDWVKYIGTMNKDKAIEEYEEWVAGGTIRRIMPKLNKIYSRPYANESREQVLEWHIWCSAHESEVAFDDYTTWPELWELFEHIWEVVRYDDNTQTFQIYTRQSSAFQIFKEELNLIVDKVTHKAGDNSLIFPIFDHYLSAGGNSAILLYDPKTERAQVKLRYGGIQKFANLAKAFEYLKQERYYE